MHFLYIDESYYRHSKYIVLGGVIISEEIWTKVNNEIINLKRKFFTNDELINLKDIRRKKYDPSNSFNELSTEKQKDFETELYQILSAEGLIYLAALIDKSSMETNNKDFLFRLAYSFLIQRFEFFLKEKEGRGMIIMDKSKNEEITKLFDHHREFTIKGIPFRKRKDPTSTSYFDQYEFMHLQKVIENLLFQDDNYSNHLQISDMICAAISSKFNRGNDYYYNKIIKNIRKSPTGTIDGWGIKIFPTS